MLVILPKPFSGASIVSAFVKASQYEESSKVKFVPERKVESFRYELSPFRLVTHEISVFAKRWYSENKHLFSKETKWFEDNGLIFSLQPVVLDENYSRINISIRYVFDVDQGGGVYVATDPTYPEFEQIRLIFEMILVRFQSFLAE